MVHVSTPRQHLTVTLVWRQGIGDDADVESSSAATVQTEEGYQPVFFDPRPLKNLLLIDEMESLSPIMDLKARYPLLARPALRSNSAAVLTVFMLPGRLFRTLASLMLQHVQLSHLHALCPCLPQGSQHKLHNP